nr:sodium channel modifier 1-like [Ipomoea batatas]
MSVFGGDSWAREAQHRKRRVDDLVIGSIGGALVLRLQEALLRQIRMPCLPSQSRPRHRPCALSSSKRITPSSCRVEA